MFGEHALVSGSQNPTCAGAEQAVPALAGQTEMAQVAPQVAPTHAGSGAGCVPPSSTFSPQLAITSGASAASVMVIAVQRRERFTASRARLRRSRR